MKKNIHPNWHDNAAVVCSCGNTFTTGSTLEKIEVEICSKCHPFFTGEMKFVDQQGRVDKFRKKMEQAKKQQQQAAKKKKAKDENETKEEEPLSYQQILREKRSQLRKEK